jgi:hypothetical protein
MSTAQPTPTNAAEQIKNRDLFVTELRAFVVKTCARNAPAIRAYARLSARGKSAKGGVDES